MRRLLYFVLTRLYQRKERDFSSLQEGPLLERMLLVDRKCVTTTWLHSAPLLL